jgi:AP-2 complex subunit alpha
MVFHQKSPEELLTTVFDAIKTDLTRHDDTAQCLALACIANMDGTAVAPQVASSVQRLLVNQDSHVCVKKKAALCLLRLFRTNPEVW